MSIFYLIDLYSFFFFSLFISLLVVSWADRCLRDIKDTLLILAFIWKNRTLAYNSGYLLQLFPECFLSLSLLLCWVLINLPEIFFSQGSKFFEKSLMYFHTILIYSKSQQILTQCCKANDQKTLHKYWNLVRKLVSSMCMASSFEIPMCILALGNHIHLLLGIIKVGG